MAYFAELDGNKVVKRVIVADQSFIDSGILGDPKSWVETDLEGKKKKNYAGVGMKYDKTKDAFISDQPYPSWVLNSATALYEAPVPEPKDGKVYVWDETKQKWVNSNSANAQGKTKT